MKNIPGRDVWNDLNISPAFKEFTKPRLNAGQYRGEGVRN